MSTYRVAVRNGRTRVLAKMGFPVCSIGMVDDLAQQSMQVIADLLNAGQIQNDGAGNLIPPSNPPSSDRPGEPGVSERPLEPAHGAANAAPNEPAPKFAPAVQAALHELQRAVRKFPTWPADPLHAIAVLGEEFGELTQAVLQHVYEGGSWQNVHTEARQCAGMALRFLQAVLDDSYAPKPSPQIRQVGP